MTVLAVVYPASAVVRFAGYVVDEAPQWAWDQLGWTTWRRATAERCVLGGLIGGWRAI